MITREQAGAYLRRTLWDGMFDPYRVTKAPSRAFLASVLLEVLDKQIDELGAGNVRVVLLPYVAAGVLRELFHRQLLEHVFDANPAFQQSNPFCGVPSHETPALWGSIGTYRGIELLVTPYLTEVWVTTAATPNEIDGENTLFIELEDE